MSDARLALRFLLKKPGWTVAAVRTVAIGIAGATRREPPPRRLTVAGQGLASGRQAQRVRSRNRSSSLSVPRMNSVSGSMVAS